jgi:MoaA/NifB/PqqE/SkfB family radical SAM enzyme
MQKVYKLKPSENRWLPNIKYVQVATHSRCNADCVFCPYIESAHKAHPGMMTDETWKTILLNLVPWKDSLVKFCPYLMQEPLIDKTIFAKIEQIYEFFPNVRVEISTNGAALTTETIGKLFKCFEGRNHELWVSHHGIDKSTLQQVMNIDYDKAHNNLINLIKKSDGRFNIVIRGAGESKAVEKVYFTHEQYMEYWTKQIVDHNLNMKNVSIDSFKFHDRAGSLHREDRGACNLNKGKVRDIGPNHKPFYCPRVDEWVHFMHDGSIRLCCMDYHHEIKLPNINDTSLLDYFHRNDYDEIVRKVSGRIETEDNFICKRCTSPGG